MTASVSLKLPLGAAWMRARVMLTWIVAGFPLRQFTLTLSAHESCERNAIGEPLEAPDAIIPSHHIVLMKPERLPSRKAVPEPFELLGLT